MRKLEQKVNILIDEIEFAEKKITRLFERGDRTIEELSFLKGKFNLLLDHLNLNIIQEPEHYKIVSKLKQERKEKN